MIQRGYREFIIDLAACDHMDSTFMGTLTGISQNLRQLGQGSLRALNVSPRNPIGEEPKLPAEQGAQLMMLPTESGPEKEVILAAHEALVAANPVNADRFRDVMEYLKQDSGESR